MLAASILRSFICGLSAGEEEQTANPIPHYRRTDVHSVYAMGDRLGQCGTFGEARAAVHRGTGQAVAIKHVRKHKCLVKMLRTEEQALKVMQHGNISRLYAVYEDRKSVYFVMEKCTGGDLIDLIMANNGRLAEASAKQVCRQLASGIAHLHNKGFAHCDIKPSNILFQNGDLKLIDFGVSQIIGPGCVLHAEVGSPSFMAPEIFSGSYTASCDLWSLGVVLFVMLFGFNPFNPRAESECCVNGTNAHVHRKICARVVRGFDSSTRDGYGAFFPRAIPVSEDACALMSALLSQDPKSRPTPEAVLGFQWLA